MVSGAIICRFPGMPAVAGQTPSGGCRAVLQADIPLIGGLTFALKVFRRETKVSLFLKSEDSAEKSHRKTRVASMALPGISYPAERGRAVTAPPSSVVLQLQSV